MTWTKVKVILMYIIVAPVGLLGVWSWVLRRGPGNPSSVGLRLAAVLLLQVFKPCLAK